MRARSIRNKKSLLIATPPSHPRKPLAHHRCSFSTSSPHNETKEISKPIPEEPRRYPKKKVAMLLAYIGTKYSGLQRNPGVHTVEDELESAIFKAGGMLPENLGELQKIGWRRSGRTDKGVHSLGNVVAMKMQLRPGEPLNTLRQRINLFLPDDIRLLGIERTTKGFTPRRPLRREYHYLLPYDAFTFKSNLSIDQCFSRLQDLLPLFQGTHNFHNYTNRKLASDPSTARYIISTNVEKTFNDSFFRVAIIGQSFLNHQVRKMIGALVAAIRQDAPATAIKKSFDRPMHWLPTAPPDFLVKMKSDYENYNQKWAGTSNGQFVRQSLDFPTSVEEMRVFEEKLMNHIQEHNKENRPFIAWLDGEFLRRPVEFDKILSGEPTRFLKSGNEAENNKDDQDDDEDDEEDGDKDED